MQNKLWDLINKIHEKADNRTDFVNKCNDYWDGKLHKDKQMFNDQDRTAFNVVKPIVETKLKAMLDAQFTLAVVPKVTSFSSLSTIQNHQAIADIFNDELFNIFSGNNMSCKNELISRAGLNCGFGVAQVVWDDTKDERGDIKISYIPSNKLKWDREATSIEDASFVGYSFSLSASTAKERYAKDEDGNYDEKLCKKIDNITEDQYNKYRDGEGKVSGIMNYSTTSGSGQLYTKKGTSSISTGKVVNLICLFLVDDTIYAPEKNESDETKEVKEEGIRQYPNGRMIIFSANEKEKLILEDVALPETFNSLGNISIFNPIIWEGVPGKGEISDLFSTQDRIDGLYNKYRKEIENDITAIIMEKDEEISLNSYVDNPVMFINRDAFPPTSVSNNGLANAQNALTMIENLENHAAKMARVNETMIYGYRQTGTTSGDQVEALQESPLADIRSMQRNFKDFLVNVGNKALELIKNNYTVDRLIKLSTGMTDAEYAKLQLNATTGEQEMVLVDEAGQAIQTIKMSDDWEFAVEVVAGTEVPRTRREQAQLMDMLVERGILNLQDIDMVQAYLKAQDVPNNRLIIKILKEKQQQAQQRAQSPEATNWKEMMKNPDIAKVFADNFEALSGYPEAQQQMLNEIGLVSTPAKLDTSPVTEITKESDVAEVATIAPGIISSNPAVVEMGRDAAIAEQLTDTL